MSNFITYPHGFRSLSVREKDTKENFVYDRDVETLFRSYINHEVDFNNWDYRLNVLEETFRLFGDNFEEWVLYQINKNTLIYDHSLDFLLDTINFISGQQRKVPINAWRELMLVDPENKSNIEISNRKIGRLKDVYPRLPTMTSDVIQLWCSQEDGFEDMITSLFLFFGPAISMNNRAIQSTKM